MTEKEPMQLTIVGREVPYSQTLPKEPTKRKDLRVEFSVTAECDFDLKMEACDPSDEGYETAGELIAAFKKEYKSVRRWWEDWGVGESWRVYIAVSDPQTGKSSYAEWAD